MLDVILDVVIDTLIDAAKLIPFLYFACLLMEYLEHKSGDKSEVMLKKAGKVGPLVGSLLGVIPQCGFSAAASGLYAGRIITTGTLIAVYLSTSDEMLPILVSSGAPISKIITLLIIKFIIGLIIGFIVDGVTHIYRNTHPHKKEHNFEDLCEREHCHCEENNNIFLAALIHTLKVTAFILVFTFLLNLAIEFIGEEVITGFISARPVLAVLCSSVIGLIPNCASSVIITELYLNEVISLGVSVAGLCVNAGVGLAILFRNNRPFKDSLRILAILFGGGVVSGLAIELITGLLR